MSFSPDVVYALLDSAGRIRQQPGGGEFVDLLSGVWHTAKVFKPHFKFFITMGAGTEHRPA